MATVLYIDPTALGPGGALEAYASDPSKIRFDLGQVESTNNRNGAGIGVQYTRADLQKWASRSVVVITTDTVTIDNDQVNRWPQFNKNALADLVAKGLVVAERPAGAPVTPTAIRGW